MISQNKFFTVFQGLTKKSLTVSISGESGLGKTSLALYLIGNLIQIERASCIWVQASESFPKKRLNSMFQKYNSVLDYLNNNVFIIPKYSCKDFLNFKNTINLFLSKESVFPPNVKYIVIDNISHHLRYKLEQIKDINNRTLFLNDFFNSFLQPFLMFCASNNIIPILVHEMSFNPGLNQNKIFFYKLFERIESVSIFLNKDFVTNSKHMTITYNNQSWKLNYVLSDSGFEFYA